MASRCGGGCGALNKEGKPTPVLRFPEAMPAPRTVGGTPCGRGYGGTEPAGDWTMDVVDRRDASSTIYGRVNQRAACGRSGAGSKAPIPQGCNAERGKEKQGWRGGCHRIVFCIDHRPEGWVGTWRMVCSYNAGGVATGLAGLIRGPWTADRASLMAFYMVPPCRAAGIPLSVQHNLWWPNIQRESAFDGGSHTAMRRHGREVPQGMERQLGAGWGGRSRCQRIRRPRADR